MACETRPGYEEVTTGLGNSVCYIHQHIVFILSPSTQAVELEIGVYSP